MALARRARLRSSPAAAAASGAASSSGSSAEGASVVFAEIDADRARETQAAVGERCVGVVCDVREPDTAAALVTAARDDFGRVDVLVNNVGHYGGARKAFHEQTDEEWDELYRVNLGHVFDVLARRAAGAARTGRRRQRSSTCRRSRRSARSRPARCTPRSRAAITGLHALARGRVRHGTGSASTRSRPTSPRRCRCRTRKWVEARRRAPHPHVGAARPFRAAERRGRRRAVPRVRPLGVRDRNDRARRRRHVRRERMVPDRGGWMDQPAAATLTVPDLAQPASIVAAPAVAHLRHRRPRRRPTRRRTVTPRDRSQDGHRVRHRRGRARRAATSCPTARNPAWLESIAARRRASGARATDCTTRCYVSVAPRLEPARVLGRGRHHRRTSCPPVFVIRFVLRERVRDYGLRVRGIVRARRASTRCCSRSPRR